MVSTFLLYDLRLGGSVTQAFVICDFTIPSKTSNIRVST